MDAIAVGWNKHSSDEVQSLANRQYFQQDSTEKLTNQDNKCNKKKVHFSSNIPNVKPQSFENTEQNHSKTYRRPKLVFDDHGDISASSNTFTAQLPQIRDEPICSARGTIITFIIVVVIILVVAIAVGVVFGTIKTSQSAKESTNQSSFSTVSTIVMTSSVSIGSQNGIPCSSYTTINDPSRSVTQIGATRPCDNGPLFNGSSDGSWTRFVGSGGTIMPSSSPGFSHCGAYASGWFNGTLPTTLGTMINGSVCFATDIFNCLLSYRTSVIYCNGSFYVYLLKPVTFCNSRYCTA